MDFSSRSNMLYLFKEIIQWRRENYIIPIDEVEIQWSELHLSIVRDYFSSFSEMCEFQELPSTTYFMNNFRSDKHRSSRIFTKIAASFTHELRQWFMVPEGDNRIKKYHLVEAFISFLLQLLYHKTDSIIYLCDDRIDNFEKGLRFLLTILGDTSVMLCADEHEEFCDLLKEFKEVANGAGNIVHSLFFSAHRAFEEIDEDLAVVDHIGILEAHIKKFLDLPSFINRSAYITPNISVMDSLLIVDSLVYNLEDLMKREDNQIADVKGQIEILHQRLILIQSSFKNIGSSQHSEIGGLKEPLMRIGDVAHDAEYLIISYLVGDAPPWYLITRLTDFNCRIELIENELQEFTKKDRSGDLKVAKYFSAQLPLQAKSDTEVDDATVGLGGEEADILDQLVGGTERLQIISIYGMPGLGKTTLARNLYNHPSVNCHFDKLSWCVISQRYQRQSILTDMLIHLKSELGKDSTLKMDEKSLVEYIYETLEGGRYLIVLDDIGDSNLWDDLQRCFPDNGNGSRILCTTRNKDVAPPNSKTHELRSLSNDQCWELLKKKVFDNEPCPPQLLEIGEKIAKNCRGLPLAVVVIAGILSTMDKEKSEWEEVEANLTSYIFEDGDNTSVMQILELSYQHLPDNLKACFLYFGAFEEDKEISVRELMRLWIAEGFIHKEEGKSAENIAEEYLKQLIDRSLLMDAKKRSGGGVKTCVIHDLFRELCLKISEKENFFKFVKNDIYSMYEKGHRIQALKHPRNSSYCQQVRSFRGGRLNSDFYVRDMRSLRVLHFDYVDNHFIGIEYLVYLRYLVIRNLPASVEIDSLVNLEYLRVETDEGNKAVDLPPEIREMRKLRYLHVHPRPIYIKCRNSSQTNNLEFLSCVWIGKFEDEEMLQCSPHLQKLKCIYELVRLVGIRAYSIEYPHFDLSFFTQLDSLNLTFRSHHDRLRRLEKFTFPSNIRKLTLSGKSSQNIMSIIGGLENLEVLKLRFISFEEHRWDIRDEEFRKLRFLKLEKTNLTKWNVDLSQHFPPLQQLVLRDCYKLQEIPSDIFEITTLQMIEVKGRCLESLVELVKSIQKQQSDYTGSEELRVSIGRR